MIGRERRQNKIKWGGAFIGRKLAHRLRRFLNLDEAHAAVSGDGEALVEAEARDVDPRRLDRLQDARAALDLHRVAVNDNFYVLAALLGHKGAVLVLVDWEGLLQHGEAVLADRLDDLLLRDDEGGESSELPSHSCCSDRLARTPFLSVGGRRQRLARATMMRGPRP